MIKKTLVIVPAIALMAAVATPASAKSCAPQEVKQLEMDLAHLRKHVEVAEKDPNQKRRAHETARLKSLGRHVEEAIKSCKEGRRRQCSAEERKKLDVEMHHLKEVWHHIKHDPDTKRRKQEEQRLHDEAEHVMTLMRFCKR